MPPSLILSSSRNFQHILHPSWPARTCSRRSPSPASARLDSGHVARRDGGNLRQQSMLAGLTGDGARLLGGLSYGVLGGCRIGAACPGTRWLLCATAGRYSPLMESQDLCRFTPLASSSGSPSRVSRRGSENTRRRSRAMSDSILVCSKAVQDKFAIVRRRNLAVNDTRQAARDRNQEIT